MAQLFNGAAFFIVLREVLEACLIVALLLATLAKTGATHLRRFVWTGTVLGVLVSLSVGIGFTVVFYTRGEQLFSDKAEKIFEGIAFLLAALLLVWVGLWTRSSALLIDGLQRSVERALDVENEAEVEVARKARPRSSVDFGNGGRAFGGGSGVGGAVDGRMGARDEDPHGYLADDEVDGSDGEAGADATGSGVQLGGDPEAAVASSSASSSSRGSGDTASGSHRRSRGALGKWRRRRKQVPSSVAERSFAGTGGGGGAVSFRSGSGSLMVAGNGKKKWLSAETRTKLTISSVAFAHVLREGIETFIFVFGASKVDSRSEWKGVLLPAGLALIVGFAIAFSVVKGLATVDIAQMLAISGVVLLSFAAGLTSHGFHELSEAEWFGTWGDKPLERDWWNASMWSTKGCCDDSSNEFFALLRALFGYQDQPTFIEIGTYFGFVFILAFVFLYLERARVVKARNRTARWARLLSALHLSFFLLGFVFSMVNPTWTGIVVCSLGLVLSACGVFVSYDLVAKWFESVRSSRRMIAIATGVGVALLGVFIVALHVVQCSCLGETCELPAFFYWGLIFSGSWLSSARTETSWVPLGVLSVSMVLSAFSLAAFSVALILFSFHVDPMGNYVYAKERVKVGAAEGVFDEDIDDASASLERSVGSMDPHGELGRIQLGLGSCSEKLATDAFSSPPGQSTIDTEQS